MSEEWKPIESAPKVPGRLILAVVKEYFKGEPQTRVVHWDDEVTLWQDSADRHPLPDYYRDEQLSHWMPLPEPPKEKTDD